MFFLVVLLSRILIPYCMITFNKFMLSFDINDFWLCLRHDVEVKFPISSGVSSPPTNVIETEEQIKLMKWKKERLIEDMHREETLLNQVKKSYMSKKHALLELLK